MISKRSARFLVPVAILAASASLTAHAGTKNWMGCPITSFYGVDPGPKFSVSWSVSGEPAVISFQRDRIQLGGGKGMMTLGQLNQWKHFLDELRTAAVAKVKVQVYYDEASRRVLSIVARYNRSCP